MSTEIFGETLLGAWNEPWFVPAALILDPFDGVSLEQRKAEAIRTTGISGNMLSRYLSVLARIREISRRHSIPLGRLVTPVFSATEIAVRIYDKDPVRGLAALEKLKERRTTLVKLRLELADIEKRRAGDKLARGKRIEECEVALRRYVEQEFDAASTLARRPALAPFSKVGWLVLDANGQPSCGIDLFDSEGQMLEAKLVPAILLSSFFKQFFILFHDAFDEGFASSADATLDFFRAHSFGTLYLSADGSIETIRPATGTPFPDRSADYAALEAMFAYGRGPRLGDQQ